ncbi:three component ABC system middle component [Pseudomonas sp. SH1-B]
MDKGIRRSAQDPDEDIYLVQNPALGAALVWRFVEAYAPKAAGRLPALPLLFIILPIIYRKELRDVAASTQLSSGLRLFAGKFKKEQEILHGIQTRILLLKELSLSSISIALQCGLINIDTRTAEASSLRQKAPRIDVDDIKHMMRSAEKLGHWCKDLTLQEVQAILRIKF